MVANLVRGMLDRKKIRGTSTNNAPTSASYTQIQCKKRHKKCKKKSYIQERVGVMPRRAGKRTHEIKQTHGDSIAYTQHARSRKRALATYSTVERVWYIASREASDSPPARNYYFIVLIKTLHLHPKA